MIQAIVEDKAVVRARTRRLLEQFSIRRSAGERGECGCPQIVWPVQTLPLLLACKAIDVSDSTGMPKLDLCGSAYNQ